MLHRIAGFVYAVMTHIRSGRTLLTESQLHERLDICKECPHFRGDKCNKCGCCAGAESHFFNKLAYPLEQCPDTPPRWGPVESDRNDDT